MKNIQNKSQKNSILNEEEEMERSLEADHEKGREIYNKKNNFIASYAKINLFTTLGIQIVGLLLAVVLIINNVIYFSLFLIF
jgi:hypothetical protein